MVFTLCVLFVCLVLYDFALQGLDLVHIAELRRWPASTSACVKLDVYVCARGVFSSHDHHHQSTLRFLCALLVFAVLNTGHLVRTFVCCVSYSVI